MKIRKLKLTVLTMIAAFGLFGSDLPALGDKTIVEDTNDSGASLDLARGVAKHVDVVWGSSNRIIEHKLRFHDQIGAYSFFLNRVLIKFDLNNHVGAERRIVIAPVGQGAYAAAALTDSGELRGFANAYVLDGDPHTFVIHFPIRLLANDLDSYRWRVLVRPNYANQPDQPECHHDETCLDRLPEKGWIAHDL